jgi:hypothetical protein
MPLTCTSAAEVTGDEVGNFISVGETDRRLFHKSRRYEIVFGLRSGSYRLNEVVAEVL